MAVSKPTLFLSTADYCIGLQVPWWFDFKGPPSNIRPCPNKDEHNIQHNDKE